MNWLRLAKGALSDSSSCGPSKTYAFSTGSRGNSRHKRLSSSRSRVTAFSFASNASHAAGHSSCVSGGDCTIGVALLVAGLPAAAP